MFDFSKINYLAVLVAAIAAYFLGTLWYSGLMFGKPWRRALGKTKQELTSPTVPMLLGFVCIFITALGLALILTAMRKVTLLSGISVGAIVAVAFVAANMFSDYLYSSWSLRLYLIQAGYRMISIIIMGAIIGAW
ncbi:MAG: DUF1761 domain-containing protein [candidate division KSB1 bacterium]|nr:DUF1761 domain-containing protein [candidate division KSB1 bacterium]MDZ7342583.1 DUF1761 domain-containing protein [candidate division KSB1 bacterium]